MYLTQNQLKNYNTKGYVLVKQLFSSMMMDSLNLEIKDLHQRMANKPPSEVLIAWEENSEKLGVPKVRQLLHSELISPIIKEMSRSPDLLDIVEQLMGPDICLSSSKLMMKSAGLGGEIPWHQDWSYWIEGHCKPILINCFLAIDPATEENGGIRFVEGSHLNGLTEHGDSGSEWFNLQLGSDMSIYNSHLVEMDTGDAIFFGPLIIHGSGPNSSSNDRRMNTFVYDQPNNLINGKYSSEKYLRISNNR